MKIQDYLIRAWKDTWSVMGGWTALIPLFLIFPVGFGLHLWQEGKAEAMPELQVFGVYGLQATGAVFGSFYLWNLMCAPYRIVRDELNGLKAKIGIGEPTIRPDLTLKEAIDYLRASEEYSLYSIDDTCTLLTDLSASKQIKIWGRDGNTPAFGYEIGATDEQILEQNIKILTATFSLGNRTICPLHDLSSFEHFKNQYIVHEFKGVNLLSEEFNGAWVNRYVGSSSSKFDLYFSKVELVRVLGREWS